jgi:hypothetical protein
MSERKKMSSRDFRQLVREVHKIIDGLLSKMSMENRRYGVKMIQLRDALREEYSFEDVEYQDFLQRALGEGQLVPISTVIYIQLRPLNIHGTFDSVKKPPAQDY